MCLFSIAGETWFGIRRWSPLQRHRLWLLAGQSSVCGRITWRVIAKTPPPELNQYRQGKLTTEETM